MTEKGENMDEQKIRAAETITNFMGGLAKRYNAETMRGLWRSIENMQRKFGSTYVADAIAKDPTDAELALFRYSDHLQKQLTEPDEPSIDLIWDRPVRWHHVKPIEKRSRLKIWWDSVKNLVLFIGCCLGTLTVCGCGASAFVYAMRF